LSFLGLEAKSDQLDLINRCDAGEQTIEFAELFATSKKLGRPIDFADCAIAACAMQNHFALATRNTKHFEGLGIELMNPWIT
jgi:toxin FitB